jgi:DNA-binding beta-propeller fold protein YncE
VKRRTFLAGAAAAPFALASQAARARLLGGTPLALVTADLESHVVAVELAGARVVRRIPTQPGPRSIETVGGRTAVIAHTTGGSISLLDAASLRVRAVLGGFGEPRYTAADPGGRLAYVTASGRGDVAVVDVLRAEVVARVELGGPARHVSLDGASHRLWVALGSKAHEVAALDVRNPRRPRLVARLRPPYLAHDVHFTPDGRSVWVTSGDRGTIGVYDSWSREPRFRIAADAPPQHVAFIGGRAYVASGDDGTLRVHDAGDGRLLRTTRVPLGSYNVQEGWSRVATPSLARGPLCQLGHGGAVEHELRLARSSHDACFVTSR